jgi:hypothetical protein
MGSSISGSAAVEVLPAPQLGAELNTDLTQASGTVQSSNTIQNAGIVGQLVPSVISTDPSGNVQIRSGFAVPVLQASLATAFLMEQAIPRLPSV